MGNFQVAIDGPVGAGKSTVARLVAARAGFLYIDTGAMYRAVGLYARREGFDPEEISNENAISALLDNITILFESDPHGQKVFLNGEDVTSLIRTPEASKGASAVARYIEVRTKVTAWAKALSAGSNVVMDGRDIGTVVLPKAQLKIYLDASVDIRAKRRHKELIEKGGSPDFEAVKEDIIQRDYNDSNRAADPLRAADDAVIIDAGDMTIEETVETILSRIPGCV